MVKKLMYYGKTIEVVETARNLLECETKILESSKWLNRG